MRKKKFPSPLTLAHWHALCHFWCLYFGTEFKCKESFPQRLPPPHPPPPSDASGMLRYCLFVSHVPISSLQAPGTLFRKVWTYTWGCWDFQRILPAMGGDQGKGTLAFLTEVCRLFCSDHSSRLQQRPHLPFAARKGDTSPRLGKTQTWHYFEIQPRLYPAAGLLQQWGTSETNLFSWSLSLWRGCKCYLSFSIKNTAGGAICLAQALAHFPDAFLCRSFYVAIC